jgi:hypothetical protein
MAKRGREAVLKRAREKARQEKREAKQARRESKSADETTPPTVDEDALMNEFARLSARFEANQISEEQFTKDRRRIFAALGIEKED